MLGRGTGMGGGSGGGSVLRVFGRAVARAGVTNLQEPISTTNSSSPNTSTTTTVTSPRGTRKVISPNNLTLSSSGSALSLPIPADSGGPGPTSWSPFSVSHCDDYDWVSVDDGSDEERPVGFDDDFVFGPVPSIDEVHEAVTALTQ
jgi:hypothetical protein